MTENEHALLLETARRVVQLFDDRNDLVVGVTAVLLDLYRDEFAAGRQTKEAVIQRLQVQAEALKGLLGDRYLLALIQTLKEGKLDAAGLLRLHPLGTA
jgi:hypothetical protein